MTAQNGWEHACLRSSGHLIDVDRDRWSRQERKFSRGVRRVGVVLVRLIVPPQSERLGVFVAGGLIAF